MGAVGAGGLGGKGELRGEGGGEAVDELKLPPLNQPHRRAAKRRTNIYYRHIFPVFLLNMPPTTDRGGKKVEEKK